MPGARPTISSPASSPPKDRTGALFQSGYLPCSSCRKATRRGQRGQSVGGSSNGWTATGRSGRPHHLSRGDFLRHVAVERSARPALARSPRDQRRELGKLDEVVGLAAQLI